MTLVHFRIIIHELLNKDTYIVTEEAALIILYISSAVCMADNGKYTKHTSHIYVRVHLVSNGVKCQMHKIYWYEGGLQLVDIANQNFGENDFNPRMKYSMVILDNY